MKKRDIFARLNSEFDELTPDVSDSLISAPIITDVPQARTEKKRRITPTFLRRLTAAFASVAVTAGVVLTVLALLPPESQPLAYNATDTFISLSINPSVSVIADSNGKVTEIITKNRDAEILLAGTPKSDLLNKDYDYVVGYLTEEAVALGYFVTSGGMNVSAVSCRGDEQTTGIINKIKTDAEGVLAAKGVTAPVTATALARDKILTEAARIKADLTGDEDLSELIEVLSLDSDYLKRLGGEIGALFGDNADTAVGNLYRMEMLEEYIELLEERLEFFEELAEFNEELADEQSVTETFEVTSGAFDRPDGWWLSWYASAYSADEELEELAEEFEELFEDYDEYGLDGLEPLAENNTPNIGASARLTEYMEVYGGLGFEEMEEYVEELEDMLDDLDDLNSANYDRITDKFNELLDKIAFLEDDWNEFSASHGTVGGVDDYLKKSSENFRATYDALKSTVKV